MIEVVLGLSTITFEGRNVRCDVLYRLLES